MFICSCGGMFMVLEVEHYPKHLTGEQKLNYPRKCTVKCNKCGKVKKDQPYD